jgi:hypothetical protein
MPARKRHNTSQDKAATSPTVSEAEVSTTGLGGGTKRVFVLGAGADIVYGLPTMTTLLRELAEFADGDGLPIQKALRRKLPRVHFKFSDFAGAKGDAVLNRLFSGEDKQLVAQLRAAAIKLGNDTETADLRPLIEHLCDLAERNLLSDDEASKLAHLTHSSYEVGGGEPVLEPKLTPMAGRAYRHVFQHALRTDAQLSEGERKALQFFVDAVSNIEDLLSDYFMRFALDKASDKKTFLYIVWMFWAFMRVKSANLARKDHTIYSQLASTLAGDVVTFNYTNFFDPRTTKRVRYFHGRLDEYLKVDTREVVRDDPDLADATTVDGIVKFVDKLRLSIDSIPEIDLPGIVPPTAFKPVMHRDQLLVWAEVDELLKNATEVVVVGYSFALADEHFNDLLRHANLRSRVVVVNPDIQTASYEACRVLGVDRDTLVETKVEGLLARRSGRLVCVAAKGEELTDSLLKALRTSLS